ncbi:hypothetical protein GGI42DRAFT_334991 [Trichoderma sp. SZMC 28013]
MNHNWQQVIQTWADNNAQIQEYRQSTMECFIKSIEPPTAEEVNALEIRKEASLSPSFRRSEFHADHKMPSFDLDKSLLVDSGVELIEALQTCSNVHLYDFNPRNWEEELRGREYNFAEENEHKKKYEWMEGDFTFPQLIQLLCLQARLRKCRWPRCVMQMRRIEKFMPSCQGWNKFREWALVAGSCQLAAAGSGYQWLEDFSALQLDNIMDLKRDSQLPGDPTLVFDICKIAHFLLTQVHIPCTVIPNGYLSTRKNDVHSWGWYSNNIPQRVMIPVVQQAVEMAGRLGICKHRLWNLAYSSEKGQDDLLLLMELAEECPSRDALEHTGHANCSAEFCLFDDVNSSRCEQLHKCRSGECYQLHFPLDQLNEATIQGRTTAWPVRDVNLDCISLSPPPANAMAISHVWSDGTGVGVSLPGSVNSCLLLYFQAIAVELGCDGIWWDTVCIPLERQARRLAISKMHDNYETAKHTIVHDEYLLNFDWADDGSPALALVLSPWFTRGWTALELSVSKSVKVLYRDPNDPLKHIIKDLDKDILASRHFKKLGHVVASTVIERLRNNEPSISNLLMVMGTRVTSWPRDRITIAALLARVPDFDYEDPPAVSTIKIMRLYLEVPLNFLLHGHDTVSPSGGGFSWCASNILDGSPATVYDMPSTILHTGHAIIDKLGAAISDWKYRLLTAEDTTLLRPHSSHLSVGFRIRKALQEKWQHCLLLYNQTAGLDQPPSLLIATAGVCWPDERYAFPTLVSQPFIDSHYIGCVFDDGALRGEYKQTVGVRIGCDPKKTTVSATEVLNTINMFRRSRILSTACPAFQINDTSSQEESVHHRRGRRFDKTTMRSYGGIGGSYGKDSYMIEEYMSTQLARMNKGESISWEELTSLTGPRGFIP